MSETAGGITVVSGDGFHDGDCVDYDGGTPDGGGERKGLTQTLVNPSRDDLRRAAKLAKEFENTKGP